ncbi:MAG: RNA ligase family protein [Algicola sp.]|nr:RNA ligase family protein [Algicola sp.]
MSEYYKYPRTPHLPWSPGGTSDDVRQADMKNFINREVVITEKMDGENTSLYPSYIHARSIDGRHHPSRDWVKRLHASMSYQIPQGWRVCGENLFAQHAIGYKELTSYFHAFAIFNDNNVCLGWADTVEMLKTLGLEHPKVLYQGIWDEKQVRQLTVPTDTMEGYVVRVTDAYAFDEFKNSVAKWVRPAHVQTDKHWMHAQIVPNKLKEDS